MLLARGYTTWVKSGIIGLPFLLTTLDLSSFHKVVRSLISSPPLFCSSPDLRNHRRGRALASPVSTKAQGVGGITYFLDLRRANEALETLRGV